jgi:hypothetical protein
LRIASNGQEETVGTKSASPERLDGYFGAVQKLAVFDNRVTGNNLFSGKRRKQLLEIGISLCNIICCNRKGKNIADR